MSMRKEQDLREEIEILKRYYGFDEASIKELKEKNQLAEVINIVKLEYFSLCKGGGNHD